MATVEQIAERALKRLGVVQAGASASAVDVTDATVALNAMINAWEAQNFSGDVLPLDARFEQAVVAMLAVRLAEEYGRPVGDILARDAELGERQLRSAYFAVPQSVFEAPLRDNGMNVTDAINAVEPANYTPWQAGTDYPIRSFVILNGNLYECVTGGMSGATGPSGTGSAIADGAAVWCWRKAIGAI